MKTIALPCQVPVTHAPEPALRYLDANLKQVEFAFESLAHLRGLESALLHHTAAIKAIRVKLNTELKALYAKESNHG